ncbi:MAG: phage minor head protein, partial [Oscillospiraceae bacterium]
IASRLAKVENMNANVAIRTARTAVTSAENKGRLDGLERAQKDGIILKKRWIATHDARVRDWHAELDGQIVDIDKPFENSIGEIMYPGDPAADGANIYNCRCTMVGEVLGFKG